MSARATEPTSPTRGSRARPIPVSSPTGKSSARATSGTSPIPRPRARASAPTSPISEPSARADLDHLLLSIRTLGDQLDDLERVRIANGNRIAQLERTFGSGLACLDVTQRAIRAIEHEAELELKRMWRKYPLAPWAKEIPGCGEKLIARLIAVIGDPAERPNPAKLWAYCGHGEPTRRRGRGMTQAELFACGNPEAKKRVYLLASQFRRTPGSPYRLVYDEARERYRDRVHESACVRCGPAGKPAPAGSPWTLAHQDAAALRFVGKVFLRDLWHAARSLHTLFDDQGRIERAGER